MASLGQRGPDVADSLLDDVAARLDAALHHAQVSDDALERLRYPKSTLKVSIPVRSSCPLAVPKVASLSIPSSSASSSSNGFPAATLTQWPTSSVPTSIFRRPTSTPMR